MKKRKKIAISASCILVGVIVVGGSVFAYQQYTEEQENNKTMEQICSVQNDFSSNTEHNAKLNCLRQLTDEYNAYLANGKDNKQVIDSYTSNLNTMKQWFYTYYDQAITENTIINLGEQGSIDAINESKTKLESIKTTINMDSQEGYVCTEEQLKAYNDKIDGIIASYNERIDAINAEAAAQAEAAAAAQAAQQSSSQSQSYNNSNDYSYNSGYSNDYDSGYSNDYNSGSTSSQYSWWYFEKYDENGNVTESGYVDPNSQIKFGPG